MDASQLNDLLLFPGPDPLLLVDDNGDHLLGVQVERFSLSCVFTSTERLNMAPRVMKSHEEVGVNTDVILSQPNSTSTGVGAGLNHG